MLVVAVSQSVARDREKLRQRLGRMAILHPGFQGAVAT
jgi:hypothetical protein